MVQRLLLDTNALLWVAEGGHRLRTDTLEAIDDLNNEVYVSAVSIWEIAIRLASGKLPPSMDLEKAKNAVDRYSFIQLNIDFRHAELAARLPLNHRDPFDRMLVAQAQTEGLVLVTDDSQIASYDVTIMLAR